MRWRGVQRQAQALWSEVARTCRPVRLAALLLWLPLTGAAEPVKTEHVTARLIAERGQITPGASVDLALVFDIQPGWHTYWRNPGDSGEAPRIAWTLPKGVVAGPIRWPHPELIRVGPLANYGYSGRAVHLVSLSVPRDWVAGTPIVLRADAHWLVCAEECIPESGVLELTLPTSEVSGAVDPTWAALFARARESLPAGRLEGTLRAGPGEGRLRLSIRPATDDVLSIEPAASPWFFAGTWGLIEHAADQPWRISGERLEIDLTPGTMAATADPDGVLVVTGADGRPRSFSISASRDAGPLPASNPETGALSLPTALVFALLGGLILNLMPCVFPVLAIKVLSLTGGQAVGASQRVLHGFAYTGGVLLFFGFLGVLLLALRAGGAALGWGFQLQYPPFVALMALVFLVVGLALAGAVTLGTRLMALGGGQQGGGVVGAFSTGALAALVAAPCTAPFMGAALGYALTLAWFEALVVMLTLGLGLALPFLLLSLSPALARRLPRPGSWMETLKQGLAFPMLGAAAWLVWVLGVQTGPDGLALVLTAMVLTAFGLWVRERSLLASPSVRQVGAVVAAAGIGVALWLSIATGRVAAPPAASAATAPMGQDQGLTVKPYSARRLDEARAARRPVLVNMTAAWCITCLVNERIALSTADTAELFSRRGLIYLKGDWTNRDPAITQYLASFGRTGVPLYVYYAPGQAPRVLPQILTAGIVRDAVEGAAAPTLLP